MSGNAVVPAGARAGLSARPRLRFAEPVAALVPLGVVVLLGLVVVLPILGGAAFPQLGDYFTLPANGPWVRATTNTLWMVVLSTASATGLGFIYAFALSCPEVRGRSILRLLALLPLFSPPFTLGFSYLLMFGRFGVISHGLAGLEVSILGWWSLWIVQTLTNFPYAALAIERMLAAVPPRLEAAGRNLGGGGLAVFRTVTLPLLRPAVAGAALLVAIYVLADFANPLIIGGDFPLLATEAWYRIDGWADLRGATLLVTTLLPPALCLFAAERYWVSRRAYTVVSGRGTALEQPSLAAPVRWALVGFCAAVGGVILALYFGVVAGAFTRTWGVDWTPTLERWVVAFDKSDHLANSLLFAAAAGFAATGFALIAAYLVD